MIQSLFLLSPTGEVIIERHFRGVVTERAVCEAYWNTSSSSTSSSWTMGSANPADSRRPPVCEVPSERQGTLYCMAVQRDTTTFLAVCPAEVSPLQVLELLHCMASTMEDYFGNADESAIKENFSTVYQLLEEMVDYGWPLTTEGNALKAMIRPPTVMSKLLMTSGGAVADMLPVGTVSNMPWRTANVHYSNNEIYVDIVEEVDAIVDATNNTIVSADVLGSIQCQSHLSGIPDLLLTFTDPSIVADCSFHPCVRYARFERDGVVSFVPPDGQFELMRYRIDSAKVSNFLVPPVTCQAQWTCDNNNNNNSNTNSSAPTTGRLHLQVSVTPQFVQNLTFSASAPRHKVVEDVAVTIPFPQRCSSTTDFRVNMGTVLYDEASKVARWTVAAQMDPSHKATLTCKFTLAVPVGSSSARSASSSGGAVAMPSAGQGSTRDTAAAAAATLDLSLNHHLYYGMSESRQRLCARQRRRRGHNNTNNNQSSSRGNGWMASPPNLSLNWKIPLASVSSVSVSGLSVTGEAYRPYKGVRNITKAGLFQVRYGS